MLKREISGRHIAMCCSLMLASLAFPACSSNAGEETAGPPALTMQGTAAANGREVVATVCGTCHTELPPSKLAPPFRTVALNYQMTSRDTAEFISRIVEWVRAPAPDRSWLSPHIIRRHGLMPQLALPDDQVHAAAMYIWSLGTADLGQVRLEGRPSK